MEFLQCKLEVVLSGLFVDMNPFCTSEIHYTGFHSVEPFGIVTVAKTLKGTFSFASMIDYRLKSVIGLFWVLYCIELEKYLTFSRQI